MKKLLTMLAMMAVAVTANAAAIAWVALDVYTMGTTDNSYGYLLLFFDAATYDHSIAKASLESGDTSLFDGNAMEREWTDDGMISQPVQEWDPDHYGYCVVFDAGSVSDAKHAFISDSETATFYYEWDEDLGMTTLQSTEISFDLSGTQDSANWYAVPEPTSGLLMLLGMAGLALKRKRA